MKKKGKIGVFIIVGIFLVAILSQSTVADDITMSDLDWIGLGENKGRIRFDDQATDEIVIKDANVGIGEGTPGRELDVVGAVEINRDGWQILLNNASHLNRAIITADEVSGNTDGYLCFSVIDDDGSGWTEVIRMYGDGKVGIGDTTPDAKLDVELSSGGAAIIGDSDASATSNFAIAMGSDADATGVNSIALGYNANATADNSIAIGPQTWASSSASVAIGYNSKASGSTSFAIGSLAEASGAQSMAIGLGTKASGTKATAMGSSITAQGDYSFGIGLDNTARTITQANTMAIMGGNVGIGTIGPDKVLEINSATENNHLRLTYNDNDGSATTYADFGVTSNGVLTIQTEASGTTEDIEIRTGGFDNAIYIDDSATGVGIGTVSPSTTFDVNGGFATEIVTKTTTYSATSSDHTILADASTGAFTITLPAKANSHGQIIAVKKIDSSVYTVTVQGSGAETIDGSNTKTLSNQYDSILIQCDDSGWHILAS